MCVSRILGVSFGSNLQVSEQAIPRLGRGVLPPGQSSNHTLSLSNHHIIHLNRHTHQNSYTDQPPEHLSDRFPDLRAEHPPTAVHRFVSTSTSKIRNNRITLTTDLIISFNTVNLPSISSTSFRRFSSWSASISTFSSPG
jgi:hypothetical protein